MSCGSLSPFCFAGLSRGHGFVSCNVLNTLSLAESLSAVLDLSQGSQRSAGSDPYREDRVDGFQSQQVPNLVFSSSGGVGKKRGIVTRCHVAV